MQSDRDRGAGAVVRRAADARRRARRRSAGADDAARSFWRPPGMGLGTPDFDRGRARRRSGRGVRARRRPGCAPRSPASSWSAWIASSRCGASTWRASKAATRRSSGGFTMRSPTEPPRCASRASCFGTSRAGPGVSSPRCRACGGRAPSTGASGAVLRAGVRSRPLSARRRDRRAPRDRLRERAPAGIA